MSLPTVDGTSNVVHRFDTDRPMKIMDLCVAKPITNQPATEIGADTRMNLRRPRIPDKTPPSNAPKIPMIGKVAAKK